MKTLGIILASGVALFSSAALADGLLGLGVNLDMGAQGRGYPVENNYFVAPSYQVVAPTTPCYTCATTALKPMPPPASYEYREYGYQYGY